MNKISKKLLTELKLELEKEKVLIEEELNKFAKKSKERKGDWDTRFPSFDGETGGAALEKAADETEEYGNLLEIERGLETKLQDINLALEKMKRGKYGICEKCGKMIEVSRLKAYPEARTCLRCRKKINPKK